jgi:hypothetical protein
MRTGEWLLLIVSFLTAIFLAVALWNPRSSDAGDVVTTGLLLTAPCGRGCGEATSSMKWFRALPTSMSS